MNKNQKCLNSIEAALDALILEEIFFMAKYCSVGIHTKLHSVDV